MDLNVINLPKITQDLSDISVEVGKELNLEVILDNTQSVTYQWYKNNEKIDNETNNKFVLNDVKLTDNGTYYLEINHPCGNLKSKEITVNVTSQIINSVEDNLFNIYPNPVSEFINLEIPINIENANISIINSVGNTIFEAKNINGKYTIDIRDFSVGVYNVNINNNNINFNSTFVIQR